MGFSFFSLRAGAARLKRGRRGNVAMIAALAAPVLIGGLGLGVETGLWYFESSQLQQAADVAAYAGASEMELGASENDITNVAVHEAALNGWDEANGSADVNIPPISGPNQNSHSVEVLLEQERPRLFSAVFVAGAVTLRARGVATLNSQGAICMLALSTTASRAANFSGNGTVTLDHCSVSSNSSASDALRVAGSALVTTDCVYSVGDVAVDDGLILTECSEPQVQAPMADDPFANVPFATTPSGPCVSAPATPSPGVLYCSLSLSGARTLAAGDYFISGGTFRINSNADITGVGVTFHLLDGATVDFNGTAIINLSAPTTGPRAGMLFMSHSTGGTNRFNGNASSNLTGALYFPENEVQFNGNFGGVAGCMQIVAETIDFTGSSTFAINCAAHGMQTIPAVRVPRLVE